MVISRLWTAGLLAVTVLSSEPRRTTAQDRAASTKDDAVLTVDGVVREIFQSARQDRVDFVVQIEVKRSEAVRAPRTPLRVPMPAPGDMVYVHSSRRHDNALGLAQSGGGQSQGPARDAIPLPDERSQVRAYLYPKATGGWEGAGSDWFDLTSRDLADAKPTDPAPAATDRAPSSPTSRPEAAPGSTQSGRSAPGSARIDG